ncbi:hypothetical protein PG984_003465 [Apiospora sp. TS-2023a]
MALLELLASLEKQPVEIAVRTIPRAYNDAQLTFEAADKLQLHIPNSEATPLIVECVLASLPATPPTTEQ